MEGWLGGARTRPGWRVAVLLSVLAVLSLAGLSSFTAKARPSAGSDADQPALARVELSAEEVSTLTALDLEALAPGLKQVARQAPGRRVRSRVAKLAAAVGGLSPSDGLRFAAKVLAPGRLTPPLSTLEQRVMQAALLLAVQQCQRPARAGCDAPASEFRSVLQRLCEHREQGNADLVARVGAVRVVMLHLSKAGGTSLCNLAGHNHCRFPPNLNNCNTADMGPPWHRSFASHTDLSCAAYHDKLLDTNATILGTEAPLDGGETEPVATLCPDLRYLTMLRQPVERTLSHMGQKGLKGSTANYSQLTLEQRLEQTPGVIDNFMSRTLLGARAYGQAPDPLGADPLAVLEQFDTVLVLEDKALTSQSIGLNLGWPLLSLDSAAGRLSRRDHTTNKLSKHNRGFLARHNRQDLALYDYARVLLALDVDRLGPCKPQFNICQ